MKRRTHSPHSLLLLAAALTGCTMPPATSVPKQEPQLAPEATAAATVAFTEGPAADAQGNIYFTETTFHRIMKLAPNGALTVFREKSNAANGLLVDPQNRLIACEGAPVGKNSPMAGTHTVPRVTRTDLATGKVEVLATEFEGEPFVGPNDVTIDHQGRLYFTDLPGGGVYRIDTNNKLSKILRRPEIQRPNGIAISPDDQTLYLVEANQAENGSRMIRAYDLQADGSVTNMRVFHNFYPGRSADGMCMDSVGNLYAIAGLHQRRGTSETLDTRPGVHVFSPDGSLVRYLPIPEDTVTNCAFGGPDLKTLYVTAGKGLYRVAVEIAGTRR